MAPKRGSVRRDGLRISAGVLLSIVMACAAQAAPRPDAEQVGAALSNFGSRWLTDHGTPGQSAHWRTETGPDQARWEGDVYVCRFEAALIPNRAGSAHGSLFSGELRVYFDPDDGGLRCEASDPNGSGVSIAIDQLRAMFPDGLPGAASRNWTQLLHLTMNATARDYTPEAPVGPVSAGTFSIPAAGNIRITYSCTVHDYAPQGGLFWNNGQRDWPGSGGTTVRTPDPAPGPGGILTTQTVDRTVGPAQDIEAYLVPHSVPAGFAYTERGTQLAESQELLVEYCPASPAPSPVPVALPGTTPQPPPAADAPPPQTGGGALGGLLGASGLQYTDEGEGNFGIAFSNGVTVQVQQYEEALRGYAPLGEMPGGDRANQGLWALEALRLNFSDPMGRLSLYHDDAGALNLYWECQVPMYVATGPYVKSIAEIGASQIPRWQAVTRNEEPRNIEHLFPGGDDETVLAQLKSYLRATGLTFDENEFSAVVSYDNGVTVFVQPYRGVAWIYAYCGGMPGGTDAGRAEAAIELLRRNWSDPLGRLSLDADNDLLWECQVPMSYLSPAFLKTICGTAAQRVGAVIEQYGEVPFNG